MKSLRRFFASLRGKLTLTYTLVTVLALLALEILAMVGLVALASLANVGSNAYLDDVRYVLSPQARTYLQPGAEDLPGLQAWLERVYASGRASADPRSWLDRPAALIVPGEPMYVLSPQGVVLAQAPKGKVSLLGQRYTGHDLPGGEAIVERALAGRLNIQELASPTTQGKIALAVPVLQGGMRTPVVGAIVVTVEPAPPLFLQMLKGFLGTVLITGLLLLLAVTPLGTLFGFIMSRGLSRRLQALAVAADAWSKGDFRLLPQDRSQDEIGYLGMRLRHMAERIQGLLQGQQELAMMEERNRLARELHDTVKQQTFATLMQVRAARNLLATDPASAQKHLEEAESLIKNSQQDLGLMIAELRPAVLEGRGLAGALQDYLDTWSQHARIAATLAVHNERSLPLDTEQALYRVAQEALANVARHSRASAVTVRLDCEAGEVSLTVADNGVGFDPRAEGKPGFGLQSMQERMAALGGRLALESTAGKGTMLTVRAPLGAKE